MLESDHTFAERQESDWTRFEQALQWTTPRKSEPSNETDDTCHGRIYQMHIGNTREGAWFRCRVCGIVKRA